MGVAVASKFMLKKRTVNADGQRKDVIWMPYIAITYRGICDALRILGVVTKSSMLHRLYVSVLKTPFVFPTVSVQKLCHECTWMHLSSWLSGLDKAGRRILRCNLSVFCHTLTTIVTEWFSTPSLTPCFTGKLSFWKCFSSLVGDRRMWDVD